MCTHIIYEIASPEIVASTAGHCIISSFVFYSMKAHLYTENTFKIKALKVMCTVKCRSLGLFFNLYELGLRRKVYNSHTGSTFRETSLLRSTLVLQFTFRRN